MWQRVFMAIDTGSVSAELGGILAFVAVLLVADAWLAWRRVRRQCQRDLENPKLLDRPARPVLTVVRGASRPVPTELAVPPRLWLHSENARRASRSNG